VIAVGGQRPTACGLVDWEAPKPVLRATAPVLTDADSALLWLLENGAHAMTTSETRKGSEGKYHSAGFRDAGRKLGLEVDMGANGWSDVQLTDTTRERYGAELELLRTSLAESDLSWMRGHDARNGLVIQCSCPEPRKLRVRESTLERGPVICGVCGSEFREA
jgi:hypothetical protein